MNLPTIAVIHGRKNKNHDNEVYAVEIRLTANRKVRYTSTGVKVKPSEWRNGYVVNRIDANILNERISVIRRSVEEMVNTSIAKHATLDLTKLKFVAHVESDSSSFISFVEERAEKRAVKDSTRERYTVFINKLREYGKIKSFSDLTTWKVKEFDEYLHGQNIMQSTIYNYHKSLKLFANEAVAYDKIEVNPYAKLRGKISRGDKKVIDYLNEDEMRMVETAAMPSDFAEHARDLFVFQMYTGLSYSDMVRFNVSDYTVEDGRYIKNDTRVKSGERYVSQLLPPAIEILKKYKSQLPIMCNADYNKALKIVQAAAGIRKNMHSHLARSTFATFMLSEGCSIQNVSKMLGHTNLKQTMQYAEILEKDVRSDYDMIAEKLAKNK
jgi:integrase